MLNSGDEVHAENDPQNGIYIIVNGLVKVTSSTVTALILNSFISTT